MKPRTILITGATDGIGQLSALALARAGHEVIVHGRNAEKLARTRENIEATGGRVRTVRADLADLDQTAAMARDLRGARRRLDVLVNNAGVLKAASEISPQGFDVRFAVNTFSPALLSLALLPLIPPAGRLVHLSSAAQAPVDIAALLGRKRLAPMDAYAQSKLALTMWSRHFALTHPEGPVSVAVNPGSLLATRMVREGFGVAGRDPATGVSAILRAALDAEFETASGRYFDNDSGRFAPPHPGALDPAKVQRVVAAIDTVIAPFLARAAG